MFKEFRTPLYLAAIASCLLVVVLNTPLKSSLFDMRDVFSLAQEPPLHKKISGVTGFVFKGDRIRTFDQPLRFRREERPLRGDKSSLTFGANLKHDKWAVCTTIHTVTQAIIDIAKDPEWAIVIVGDEGMEPLEVKGDKAFVLDAETQRAMAKDFPALFGMLPWKHFGRKNIGYLFAILHGADMVWDFDDDNFIKEGKKAASVDAFTLHEVVPLSDDCIAFNPLPLMGGNGSPTPMWPRGFPLNLIRRPCDYTLVNHGQPDSIAVFQSLADNEPDVDGIYRLTRVTPMNFQPDPAQKTLVMPSGILSPYNAQATLVMKGGLWSLLLPVSVHGRVSDIWRSYISQRLFWDIGYKLAFTPPVVDQYRNLHDPLADMQAESDLYSKSLALVKYLHRWKGTASTLPGRHEELLVNLYERDYLGKEDVLLAQEWLAALEEIGFNFPPLVGEGYIPPPVTDTLPEIALEMTAAAAAEGVRVAEELTSMAVSSPQQQQQQQKCPLANIDIFLVTFHRDFPITSLLMRSLEAFMACHGTVHVLVDEKDMLTAGAWMDTSDPRLQFHVFETPPFLASQEGYLVQMWIMMWADQYAEKTGSKADYMMFLDTDVVFGLPVTCQSLFDEEGKVYIAGWSMDKHETFRRAVQEMVDEKAASTSYMSYFPFTQPMSTFPRMRQHIAKRLGHPDFDAAFTDWISRPERNSSTFSQFAVMGAYLEHFEKELVHPIFCANVQNGAHKGRECARWVPPAAHLGWRPCWYVDACLQGWGAEYRNWKEPRDFQEYTSKFCPLYTQKAEELAQWGACFTSCIQNGEEIMQGCDEAQSRTIHPELLPYPTDPPPYEVVKKMFYVENPNSQDLCMSAELIRSSTSDIL